MARIASSPTRSAGSRPASRATHTSTGTSVKSRTTKSAPQAALDLLLDRLKQTRTNVEFLMQIAKTTPGE